MNAAEKDKRNEHFFQLREIKALGLLLQTPDGSVFQK